MQDPGFENHLPLFLNQWERSCKNKGGTQSQLYFRNLLYTNCAKSEPENYICIRNILTRMKEWEGVQHSINVTLSLTAMLCSATEP